MRVCVSVRVSGRKFGKLESLESLESLENLEASRPGRALMSLAGNRLGSVSERIT